MSKFDNRKKVEVKQGEIEPMGKDIYFSSKPEKEEYVRLTYYLTELQKKAINLMAAHEDMDKSEIVREAIDKFISQKYFDMAKEK